MYEVRNNMYYPFKFRNPDSNVTSYVILSIAKSLIHGFRDEILHSALLRSE